MEANLAASAGGTDKAYDEIEIDLAPGGRYGVSTGSGSGGGSGYVDDTTPVGTGSAHRLLPRGERCGRYFRRRFVRYDVAMYVPVPGPGIMYSSTSYFCLEA